MQGIGIRSGDERESPDVRASSLPANNRQKGSKLGSRSSLAGGTTLRIGFKSPPDRGWLFLTVLQQMPLRFHRCKGKKSLTPSAGRERLGVGRCVGGAQSRGVAPGSSLWPDKRAVEPSCIVGAGSRHTRSHSDLSHDQPLIRRRIQTFRVLGD
jgi:hypothetical protein